MDEMGWNQTQLGIAAGKATKGAVSGWMDTGGMKLERAAHLESKTPFRAEWIAYGKLPKKKDVQTRSAVLMHPDTNTPPMVIWGDVVKLYELNDLPELFNVRLMDDAMSPILPVGMVVTIRRGAEPLPGGCVLVKTRDGSLYLRKYQKRGEKRFLAVPLNQDAYAPLDSEEDGLEIIGPMAPAP